MNSTETLQKSQSKVGTATLWVSSLGPHLLSPCTSGANQFHKLNSNCFYYNNQTWTLKFPSTPMSTAPTTTMPKHSPRLVWSLLSTTSPANVNRLHNTAKRDMSWSNILNTTMLGTYGWKLHAKPEFQLLFFTITNIFSIELWHQRMHSSRP